MLDTDSYLNVLHRQWEKKNFGGVNRGADIEELVDDYLNEKDNFDRVVECDIDLANGFLRSIYLAADRPDSLAVLAKGWRLHVNEVAERIIGRK